MVEPVTLPFGKHAGTELSAVPSSYLAWACRECKLSTALRTAVAAELERRGVPVPPPPPPKPAPTCCGPIRYLWGEASNARKFIRRECTRCRKWFGAAPLTPENVAQANAAASASPHLDVLVEAEELGIRLRSDGVTVGFRSGDDWARATPQLRDRLRQCRSSLARMLKALARSYQIEVRLVRPARAEDWPFPVRVSLEAPEPRPGPRMSQDANNPRLRHERKRP